MRSTSRSEGSRGRAGAADINARILERLRESRSPADMLRYSSIARKKLILVADGCFLPCIMTVPYQDI
jgi:hypothetical protein